MMTQKETHWSTHVNQWKWLGQPLKPSPEDINCLEGFFSEYLQNINIHTPHVILLGVTPEIAGMNWNRSIQLSAVDYSTEMIEKVWKPQKLPSTFQAIKADWKNIPFPNKSIDWIVGDAVFNQFPYGEDYQVLLQSLHNLLLPQGQLVSRFFIRPDQRESLVQIKQDLWDQRISNFHCLKWKIAMALNESIESGVCLGEIWNITQEIIGNSENLSRKLGWKIEEINTINTYKNSKHCYTFPTLQEVEKVFNPYFQIVTQFTPSYPLGECCPTILFTLR